MQEFDHHDVSQTPPRVYFQVAFAKKERARRLGAQWDAARGAWYAPPGWNMAELASLQVFNERSFANPR